MINIYIPKKIYDKQSQTWIRECLKIFKILDQIVNLIMRALENWRELAACRQALAEIKEASFRETQSPLVVVITVIPPNFMLGEFKGGYRFTQ